MQRLAILALALATAPGTAPAVEIPGIQNHAIQHMFWQSPCTETVALIDLDPDATQSVQALVSTIARQAMAWGHLLGFESANPGIRGDHETILKRLRRDCAANTDATAMELLDSYANE